MISAPYYSDCYALPIVFRVVTVALSLCGPIVFGLLISTQRHISSDRSAYSDSSIETIKTFPVVLLAFCIYGFVWSLFIRFFRMCNSTIRIHPAVFLPFDLIAGGVLLGLSIACLSKIDAQYRNVLSCDRYYSVYSMCDLDRVKLTEKIGCIFALIDSVFFLILSAWWAVVCMVPKPKREQDPMYPDSGF